MDIKPPYLGGFLYALLAVSAVMKPEEVVADFGHSLQGQVMSKASRYNGQESS